MFNEFQQPIIDRGIEFFKTAGPDDRLLIASPTGTGKSVMELQIQRACPGVWIVTPVVEVIVGLLDKSGVDVASMSYDAIRQEAWERKISTPIVLRNRLLAGEVDAPKGLLWDEGHHHEAETWQQVDLLSGCPSIAFTATPFRGTPVGTQKFRERWGKPIWAIDYPTAVQRGIITLPAMSTVPILDDDIVTVENGEFKVKSIEHQTASKIGRLAELCTLDRPTMYACPGSLVIDLLADQLRANGFQVDTVTQETSYRERQAAFQRCLECESVLLQINVVSEGVDLRIRRIIDCTPMISPVKWLQMIGRIMRHLLPGEQSSEYICTNRNILRHAYLLEGCTILGAVKQAQKEFGATKSKRPNVRVLGLEGVGKFKATDVPFQDGLLGQCYVVARSDGKLRQEYAAIVHPLYSEPVWASRSYVPGSGRYDKWKPCLPPEGLIGYASVGAGTVSDAQRNWWKKSASTYGLDPDVEVNRRNFQVLPILANLGIRWKQ